ncbi:MAG TPA: RNA polymerase sigma factor [Kofleriaceae bacterium]|nr:RNA polymerase sigma factor [Kofleriaceae bacterium]
MDIDAALIERARGGERAALDQLVRATKDMVFNLAIRMLGSPSDAEDATQEILIRIVTHLGSFRGESSFRTWAYRVASNHLLTTRKRGAELRADSFDALEERLANNLTAGDPPADDKLLVREAKLICTTTMLACLDRDHRLAYILGEIFDLASDEGAAILEISPEAFRKRLSRARDRMSEFMGKQCGIVNAASACRCAKQAGHAVKAGYLDAKKLEWAALGCVKEGRPERVADLDTVGRAIEVFRSSPEFIAPESLVRGIQRALDAGSSDLLH